MSRGVWANSANDTRAGSRERINARSALGDGSKLPVGASRVLTPYVRRSISDGVCQSVIRSIWETLIVSIVPLHPQQ